MATVPEVFYETPTCSVCGRGAKLSVPAEGLHRWKQEGVSIQVAFPTLTADERELMLSGLHPLCWDALMGEEQ